MKKTEDIKMKKYKVQTLLWDHGDDLSWGSADNIEFVVQGNDHDDAWKEAEGYMMLEHNQELYNADTTIVEVQ